ATTFELLKFGACGEFTHALTLKLVKAGFDNLGFSIAKFENCAGQNHALISFYDEEGNRFAADPLLNIVTPYELFYTNGKFLDFYRGYAVSQEVVYSLETEAIEITQNDLGPIRTYIDKIKDSVLS